MRPLLRLAAFLAIAAAAAAQVLPNATPLINPVFQYSYQGAPLAGGKLCTYAAGSSTPQATYTDSTAGTPNTNPVTLDVNGAAAVFVGPNLYKFVLRSGGTAGSCADGTIVWSQDNISDTTLYFVNFVGSAGTATLITYVNPQTGGTSETVAAKLAQTVSVLDFGAKCDGSTDDSTAIGNAITAAAATSLDLVINGTAACITGAQTISNPLHMRGPGTLKRKSSVTAPIVTVTGNNVLVDGVTFDGNTQGTSGGKVVYVNGSTGFTMTRSTVANAVAGEYAVLCNACTNGLFDGNTLVTAVKGPGIDIQNGSARVTVSHNVVSHASSSNGTLVGAALGAHTTSSTLTDIAFTDNRILSTVGYCIEAAQGMGGGTVSGILMRGNTCTISNGSGSVSCTANSGTIKACGGYSLLTVQNSTIEGNSYNASGQSVDVGGISAVACTQCIITGNNLVGDTNTTVNGSQGISANCQTCVIANNLIYQFGAVSPNAGILLYTTNSFNDVDDTHITGNEIHMPSGGSGLSGVYVNCNTHGGATNSASGELISGNTIFGNSGANGIKVAANDNMCTVAYAQVSDNKIASATNAFAAIGSANTTFLGNQFVSVTNAFSDGTGNSFTYLVGFATVFANLAGCTDIKIYGSLATISDSNTNTWGANAAGGGSDNVLVWCSPAGNWNVFGK